MRVIKDIKGEEMSVTLGELLNGSGLTLDQNRPRPVVNNLGQPVYSDAQQARGKLQRRDYGVSLHASQPEQGLPYTMIDESPLGQAPQAPQGAIFGDSTEQMYPTGQQSQLIDDRMAYSAMGPYNSNRVIPSYGNIAGPTPAQQAILQAQASNQVQMDARGNRYVQMPDGQVMYLPRQQSAEAVSNAQQRQLDQYGKFQYYPGVAGGVPDLQNAIASDQSVKMGENQMFGMRPTEMFDYRGGRMGCSAALNHVMTCPLCRRYFQCDNKMYIAMMVMLIIIFSILLYMAMKK